MTLSLVILSMDDYDNNFKIAINTSQSEVRQRFTAAHELGHYLLHGRYFNRQRQDI